LRVDYEYAQHTTNARIIEASAHSAKFRREWETRRTVERNQVKVRRDLARLGEASATVA
jgi:hypothetical protein